jgi:nitrite reductase/ring-hydroxylating ferredoxin subunit
MRAMTASAEWRCAAADVPPGGSAKFRLQRGGRIVDGFLVHHGGGFYAYVNRCPHVGTPLDLWPNEFFSEDGQYLVCATHGAVFAPDTGVCVEGPCPGARLERLEVRLDDGSVVVGPLTSDR